MSNFTQFPVTKVASDGSHQLFVQGAYFQGWLQSQLISQALTILTILKCHIRGVMKRCVGLNDQPVCFLQQWIRLQNLSGNIQTIVCLAFSQVDGR